MSKAIFFNVPAHGHINPTLPVVEQLVALGDEIIYYATDEFKDKIEQSGASFHAYGSYDPGIIQTPTNLAETAARLMSASARLLPELLAVTKEEKVDYILHDSMCPWGWAVAQKLGLAAVCSTSTFAFNADIGRNIVQGSRQSIRQMAALIIASGLPALRTWLTAQELKKVYDLDIDGRGMVDIFTNRSDLNLVYTSREFQPLADQFDDSYRFVGPSMRPQQPTADFPFEELAGKHLIYISLGTIRNERLDFYRACLEALGGSSYHVVLSVGKNLAIADLGLLPDNFIVRNFMPQIELLKRTNLFITHAGMNSVNEALFFGVPLLLFPQSPEQGFVARRVQELGAGKILPESELTPARLQQLIQSMLGTDNFRAGAQKIGDSFRAAGGYEQAAAEIVAFKQRRRIKRRLP